MKTLVLSTADYAYLGEKIAAQLGAPAGATLLRKRFPDGETYLRVTENVQDVHVVLVGGTYSDSNLVELVSLGWQVVRDGARRLSLVIPYFGYSTMERAVKPGEVVRAKANAVILSSIPNPPHGLHIFLIDLHSEGIPHYFEGNLNVVHLYANAVILGKVRELIERKDLVVGSADTGRAKWVESYARDLRGAVAIVTKRRIDGSTTEVLSVGGQDVRGKTVLIYDDMIRSGGSIVHAIEAYRAAGAARIVVATTHLVLAGAAAAIVANVSILNRILDAGASDIVATNTLPQAADAVAASTRSGQLHLCDVSSICATACQSGTSFNA